MQNWGPRPFKIFNHWLRDDRFLHGVLDHCKSLNNSDMRIHDKLKSARIFTKEWNRNINGDYFKVDALDKRLAECDATTNVDKERCN